MEDFPGKEHYLRVADEFDYPIYLKDFDEDEALRAVAELSIMFGWKIPYIWNRESIETLFYSTYKRAMTEIEWDKFANTWAWRKGLAEENSDYVGVIYGAFEEILDSA
jgi:hypothetical protein